MFPFKFTGGKLIKFYLYTHSNSQGEKIGKILRLPVQIYKGKNW